MNLKESRIVGVESDAQHVSILVKLAGRPDMDPVRLTIKPNFFDLLHPDTKTHGFSCQFDGLQPKDFVATRREDGSDWHAMLYICTPVEKSI